MSTEFLITSLVVVLAPGTGVIYTVSIGIFRGWRASIAAAFGCTTGIIPHLTASILGLSFILHMSALLFQTIKYIGAAYLIYLAWSMWRETGTLEFKSNSHTTKKGLVEIATKGFLINILNPKLSIFFLAFLPLFISPNHTSPILQLLFLGSVFMAITFVVFIFYGLAANSVRRHITESPKMAINLQRTFALTIAALGLKLAVTER